ncbi:hypothetical protein [Streptomyces sp. WAC 04229]|uniref:hypothetical protein n=1 Tax=Streptomyces sp. WAC 04229 TaxID=2203206 RepID=UPI003D71099E
MDVGGARLEGPAPPLTGPAALDFGTVAEIAPGPSGGPSPILTAARDGEFTAADPTPPN